MEIERVTLPIIYYFIGIASATDGHSRKGYSATASGHDLNSRGTSKFAACVNGDLGATRVGNEEMAEWAALGCTAFFHFLCDIS